jgi:hypothetical protein
MVFAVNVPALGNEHIRQVTSIIEIILQPIILVNGRLKVMTSTPVHGKSIETVMPHRKRQLTKKKTGNWHMNVALLS